MLVVSPQSYVLHISIKPFISALMRSILYCFHKNSVIAQAILTNDKFSPVRKGSKIKILYHRENGENLREYFISFSSLLLMTKKQGNESN